MKKVAIMSRVSTTDQKEKGYSLQQQENVLRDYCKKNNFEIVKHYIEDYSAKDFNRPEFNKFLDDVESKRIKVSHIIFTKIDRFSRNMEESLRMIKKLNKKNISVQLVEGNLYYDKNIPENKLIELINMIMPQIENERISIRTKNGMRQAMKEGRWVVKAPLGYENTKIDGKPRIVPNDNAKIIKYAFNTYAKGIYSIEEVRLKVQNKYNKTIAKSTFPKMLQNIVYIGKIKIKATDNEPSLTVQAIHEPIITEKLFYNVQELITGRSKNISKPKNRKPELPLRGHLKCPRCGKNLTGSGSRSGNGKVHYYYHCQSGCKERFRADTANEQIVHFFDSIEFDKTIQKTYLDICKKIFQEKDGDNKKEISKINKQLKDLQDKIIKIDDMFIDGKFDEIAYKRNIQNTEKKNRRIKTKKI